MAKATKVCKICGREYEYCKAAYRVAGAFRYQDVACSPEHGAEYLSAVLEARGEEPKADKKVGAANAQDKPEPFVAQNEKSKDAKVPRPEKNGGK